MTQWYVKELSKMTSVSIQTLHHYDRISLLKPSIRLSNGYRVYSESDLLKLQQIIALKYFGFELSRIKMLLSGNLDVFEQLSLQTLFLEKKATLLREASSNLKSILSRCKNNKSIPWETIIKLIEVYRMTEQVEKSWAGNVLTPEEMKEYAHFEVELKDRFSEKEKQESLQEWEEIVRDINANLNQDPSSQIGVEIGNRCMNWVNNVYGKDRAALRTAIWERGLTQGHGHEEHGLSEASTAWLDKAIFAYHTSRIREVVKQIENGLSRSVLLESWEKLLLEVCGTDAQLRKKLIDDILKNERISQVAKEWIRKTGT